MSLRIAMISEHASPLTCLGGVDSGGQNVYVSQIARHLAALGHKVDVFTRRDSPRTPEVVDWKDGIRIINVKAGPAQFVPKEKLLPYMKDFTDRMLDYCRAEDYDLMHANFWMSGLVAADVKKATGLPFVITFHALGRVRRQHQGKSDGFPDERFEIEERIVREADSVIAECPQEKADLVEHYHADPARISLVPAGFDPREFEPVNKVLARIATGLPLNEHLILQLGRMVPRKGVDNVVRGLARLQQDHGVTARLVVVGGEGSDPNPVTTPEIGRLQALAEQEGVADQVIFVGGRGREMLKYYYSAADVFVTTPWYEPFGITPLEAMACATPVVGANVGGIKTTVKDGETGFLVPPNDPEALADRLSQLLQHPELVELFGLRGKQQVKDHYTWQKVTQSLAGVYQNLAREDTLRDGKAGTRAASGRQGSLALVPQAGKSLVETIEEAARDIGRTVLGGGKVLVCSHDDSAMELKELCADYADRFRQGRRTALPLLALNAGNRMLTVHSRAVSYRTMFARQVDALAQPGDLLLVIGTGGDCRELEEAVEAGRHKMLASMALVDRNAGALYSLTDGGIVLPTSQPARVKELRTLVLRMLANLLKEQLSAAGCLEPSPDTLQNAGLSLGGLGAAKKGKG